MIIKFYNTNFISFRIKKYNEKIYFNLNIFYINSIIKIKFMKLTKYKNMKK
jgi:hypothetical protein